MDVGSTSGCSRMCDDQMLLLTLEWFDAEDLFAFDKATQSNGCMASTWLRVIRSHVDIRPLRGLRYTPFWIRWSIKRRVRASSITIENESMKYSTFEGICLPELRSIVIAREYDGRFDVFDDDVAVIARGCINLLNIELASCERLTSRSLAAIGQHCKTLTSLDIRRCYRINDEGVWALTRGCMNLQSLNLTGCQLTDASLAAIGETCNGLTTFERIDDSNMTDVGLASLAQGCRQLTTINVRGCCVLTDASLEVIGETCKGLRRIDITQNHFTDVGITSLTQGCRELMAIYIASCSNLTDASLAAIGNTCKGLTSIDISNMRMTDLGIASLTQGCGQLKTINAAYCIMLTDASLEAIGEACKGLTSIEMILNFLSDVGIANLTQGCSQLQSIDISSCYELTDASLAAIGESCKGLNFFDISSNKNITDDGIASLTEGCRYLKEINISSCCKPTDASLAAIGKACKGLTAINISRNHNMTDVGIASLTQGCSQLGRITRNDYVN